MTTPRIERGFSVSCLNPQLRIPTGWRQTSWQFTKRDEFTPGITEGKIIQ